MSDPKPPDLLAVYAECAARQGRRDRRPAGRPHHALELRRAERAHEPPRARACTRAACSAKDRVIWCGMNSPEVVAMIARGAQDRRDGGAAQLPALARRGRVRRRQLRRGVRVGRRRPERALRAASARASRRCARSPSTAASGPAAGQLDARGWLEDGDDAEATVAEAVEAADDDLHVGHDGEPEGRGAPRRRRSGADGRAAPADRLRARRRLPLDGPALSLRARAASWASPTRSATRWSSSASSTPRTGCGSCRSTA